MCFKRAFQWYHSHADPIWPDGTFNTCTIYSCLWTDGSELGRNPLARFGEISIKLGVFWCPSWYFSMYFFKVLIRTYLPTQLSSYINAARVAQKIKIAFWTLVCGLNWQPLPGSAFSIFSKLCGFSSLTLVFIVACGQTGQNWVGTFSPDLVKQHKICGLLMPCLILFNVSFYWSFRTFLPTFKLNAAWLAQKIRIAHCTFDFGLKLEVTPFSLTWIASGESIWDLAQRKVDYWRTNEVKNLNKY